jgi:hypothetical protein
MGYFLFIELLVLLGIAIHGIEAFRARIPGPMRYHVAVIPFLTTLWILFHADDITAILDGVRFNRAAGLLISGGVFAAFLILSIIF